MIVDKIVEEGTTDDNSMLTANQKIGEDLKNKYLSLAKAYATYQKKLSQTTLPPVNADSLEAINDVSCNKDGTRREIVVTCRRS